MKTLSGAMFQLILISSLSAIPNGVFAQTDDFNDGNDDGWTRYDPIGSHPSIPDQATFTFPNGGYRIQTPASPAATTVGPARAGSLRLDANYTDFYVSVDIVGWDPTINNQAFGLIARIREPGLGTTDGYAMTFDFGGNDIDITHFSNEDPNSPNGGGVSVSGDDTVTMVVGRSYRFEFIGKGPELTGRVFELPDLINPVANITGMDSRYTSGFCGLLVYDNSGGAGRTDATFDNYFALDVEPPRLSIERQFFGDILVSWPADTANFLLQRTPALAPLPIQWETIDEGQIAEENGRRMFIGNEADAPKYYRLFRPGP